MERGIIYKEGMVKRGWTKDRGIWEVKIGHSLYCQSECLRRIQKAVMHLFLHWPPPSNGNAKIGLDHKIWGFRLKTDLRRTTTSTR